MHLNSLSVAVLTCACIGTLLTALGYPGKAQGQERLLPLTSLPLQQNETTATLRSPLSLPFVDDFSSARTEPDPALWIGQQVLINQTMAIQPPSIGVATFDGLAANGMPYDTISFSLASIGGADTLTSQPILLGNLKPADSVYLSFFYQPGGLGDYPNTTFFNATNFGIALGDSLVLEFKTSDGQWKRVWASDGVMSSKPFAQVFVPLTSPAFFHNSFQFRFRNYATRIGQYDCWHIDYIRLDKNRSALNDVLNDAAWQTIPSSWLRNYRAMPWNQFFPFQNQETNPVIEASVFIHRTQPANIATQLAVFDGQNNLIHLSPQNAYNLPALSSTLLQHASFTCPNLIDDTVRIETKLFLIPGFSGDIVAQNDTTRQIHVFSNYLAYDDGSAEAIYRLQGAPAAAALRFVVNQPDTLRGLSIAFARSEVNQKSNLLNLYVWKSLAPEDTLLREEFQLPSYESRGTPFVFYRFSQPVPVSDTFYVGWKQESLLADLKTDIGFDKNNTSMQHLFYNVQGVWTPSQLPGAIMLRPVLGKAIPFGVGEVAPSVNQIQVFPNPASKVVHVVFPSAASRRLDLWSTLGTMLWTKQVYESHLTLDVSVYPPGIYLLRISDEAGTAIQVFKLYRTN